MRSLMLHILTQEGDPKRWTAIIHKATIKVIHFHSKERKLTVQKDQTKISDE